MMAKPTSQCDDLMDRVHRVAEVASAYGEKTHRDGQLAGAVVDALVESNLFRLSAPSSVGGEEADVRTFAMALDAIGRADVSTGWCIVQANASARSLGSRLDHEFASELLDGPAAAIAAGTPLGEARAERVDGGHVVSGRWGFASGCLHCNWFDARAVVHANGDPVVTQTGFATLTSNLVPRDEVEVVENWDVAGLRGTGSHTYVVDEVFVPETRSLPLFAEVDPGLAPALRVPLLTFAHVGFAAMGLGAAWSALDDFRALLDKKTPALTGTPLKQTATAQLALADCTSRLRSASAYLNWLLDRLVEAAERGLLQPEDRAEARLAITSSVDTALAVVEELYRVAGTSGIFATSPLQRRFQDIHVLSQQLFARPSNYENVARLMLGLEHDSALI